MMSQNFRNKKILVTGGHGCIGSALVERLQKNGAIVSVLSRKADSINDIAVDITNYSKLRDCLSGKNFDAVYHLAAAGINEKIEFCQPLLEVNAVGTENLLRVLEELSECPIVVAGSWTEYGDRGRENMKEDNACFPLSIYGISKLTSTLIACAWSKKTHRRLVVTRFFNVYGPMDTSSRLTSVLFDAYAANQSPHLSNPDFKRDFVYIDDVVDALVALISCELYGEIINVGTGVPVSLSDYADEVRRFYNLELQPIWNITKPRMWDVQYSCADTQKIRKLINWRPKTSIKEAVSLIGVLRF